MKKIILIIFSLMLTAYSLELYATSPADSVASFTDKTTIGVTDITPLQTKVANKYTWRKITGLNLWNQITDTTEARITTLLNASNSWNGINNFDGAVFNAGSHGGVLFNGDSVTCTTQMFTHGIQRTQASSIIGRNTAPFFNVYAKTFTVINSAGNDSVNISYNDSTLSFSKKISATTIKVTGTLEMPDSAKFSGWALSETVYQPSFVTDSIIALTSMCSSVLLDPPGSMSSPGIEKITLTGAGNGQILVLTNRQAITMVFQDGEADGNLLLAGDFSMGDNDILMIKYNSFSQKWIEVSRSNN